jgi:hypothetical protein
LADDGSAMRRLAGMGAALGLHALLAGLVLFGQYSRTGVRAPPPLRPVQLVDLGRSRPGALLEEQNGAPSCLQGKAYRGVGLHADVYQRIIEVPESYPAFKAGIRRGDVLADRDIEPDADGYDTIDFKRHGIPHRLRIKTRWICLR